MRTARRVTPELDHIIGRGRDAGDNCVGRHVLGHDRTRIDDPAVTDGDATGVLELLDTVVDSVRW
jgi:hypothetical protein